jgi:hypothetical protein
MQLKLLGRILTLVIVGSLASIVPAEQSYGGTNKFFCTEENNEPVTKLRLPRGNETFIRWTRHFKGYSASRRCQIVTNQLQRFYENGDLFFKTGNVREYPVICISNTKNRPCSSDNVLVTLPMGKSANSTLTKFLDWGRTVKGRVSIPLSSPSCYNSRDTQGETVWDIKKLVDGVCEVPSSAK